MKFRSDLSIGQRLALGFGGLLLILAGVVAAVSRWQSDSEDAQRHFSEVTRPLALASAELERRVLRMGIELRSYLLQPDAARLERYQQAAAGVRVAALQLGSLPMDGGGRAAHARLAPALQRYLDAADGLVQGQVRGSVDSAAELQLAGLRSEVMEAAQRHAELQATRTNEALAEIARASRRVSTGLALGTALALLVFIGLAWYTAQTVRRPARALLGAAAALRAGQWRNARAELDQVTRLAQGTAADSRDEMVQIGHALGVAAAALERREERLAADHRVAGAAASGVVRAELATLALHAVVDHVQAQVGVVYVVDAGQGLEPIANWGLMGQGAALRTLACGEGVPGEAARRRQRVCVHDIPADTPLRVQLGYDSTVPRCVVAVPIPGRDTVLGVLLVASVHSLDEEAQQFLDSAARQLGIGLSNAYSYAEVQHLLAEVEQRNALIEQQNRELQARNQEIQERSREVQAQNEELQAQAEEIRAQNEALAAQAARVHAQAVQLAEADRRKNEFLGLLAHELRNPMAGISNSLALLSLPNTQGLYISKAQAIIARQTRQLSRLIDDLLDVTRVSHGKITLRVETLDLAQLLRDCAGDLHSALEAAQLTLTLELPPRPVYVDGDRARLSQVVGNLLDNAIKFSGPQQQVHVCLQHDEAGGRVRLSIADHGAGIDPDALERLFEPFAQADPRAARRTGGLGLGLALVRSLVELHGGRVCAHSAGAGQGARFEVDLPARGEPPPRAEPPAVADGLPLPAQTGGRPTRILIIEDNIDAADSLAAAVEAEGYDVRIAHSSLDGLQVAATFKPDVLLCDIGLPVMDGYEVARRVRADDELRSVYLVAVTGYASQRDIEQAAQAGFDTHFAKPPDLQRLSVLLAEVAIERARGSQGTRGARDPQL